MKLSEAKSAALTEHIASISRKRFICPVCGERDFTLLDGVYELRHFGEDGEPAAPLLVLVCHYCSALYFFSANALDLFDWGGSLTTSFEVRRDNLASRLHAGTGRVGDVVVLPPLPD